MKVPWGGYMFPAYDLNHSFADCDTYVSMSKLKHHWVAGVTMSLKNNFGITPCSLYGGDCGRRAATRIPSASAAPVCHDGARQAAQGRAAGAQAGFAARPRLPRAAHRGGPGGRAPDRSLPSWTAWNRSAAARARGTRASASSSRGCCWRAGTRCAWMPSSWRVMGYDPQADRGTNPFLRGDNTLKLAEAVGIGTTDLTRIEVAGLSHQGRAASISVREPSASRYNPM